MNSKYDTFWPRFLALIIDGIALGVLNYFFSLIPSTDLKILSIIKSILISNVPYAYAILMIGRFGQTVGKMVMMIKVVDNKTEAGIGYDQAFAREAVPFLLVNAAIIGGMIIRSNADSREFELSTLGYIILYLPSGMLLIWSILEIVTMLLDEKNRALHDKIADTVVVNV